MKSNDPYGIASHKAKNETAMQREQNNDHIMAELLNEMKHMNARLEKLEQNNNISK